MKAILLSLFALLRMVNCKADEPPLTTISMADSISPLAFDLNTGGHTANLIMMSSNLFGWTPYLTVISRVGVFRIIDLPGSRELCPTRFFRVRIGDAISPIGVRIEWSRRGITNYQFTFKRVCSCSPTALIGSVAVNGGKVVSVSDARDGSGNSIPNPELSQFKSIDQLFDIVQANQNNADVFAVAYDLSKFFPTSIQIDSLANTADDEQIFEAYDFQPL